MASVPLRRVVSGEHLRVEDINQFVDAIEEQRKEPEPSWPALAAVACVAAASSKPLSRRSLIGLWWKK